MVSWHTRLNYPEDLSVGFSVGGLGNTAHERYGLEKNRSICFSHFTYIFFFRIPKGKLSLLRKWHITNCSTWKT